MLDMQTFYRWLFQDTRPQDQYRMWLTCLASSDLDQVVAFKRFLAWELWGSVSD